MIYNGAYYYFEKNLFGDVLKAYNVSGTSVASFQYDSYGNVLSKSGSMWDKVHFRYRGYYYDEETSFYYLQSRYYDPSICRFISADQYELIGALSKSLGETQSLFVLCEQSHYIYGRIGTKYNLLVDFGKYSSEWINNGFFRDEQ